MDRRTFIGSTAAACVCPAALLGCGGQPSGRIEAGNIADLSSGELVPILGERVAVGLDPDGLYAISTACTHAGCDMARQGTVSSSGLDCDCHGSRFGGDGRVLKGPAKEPLPHFAVLLGDDGSITVDADTHVGPEARTPVT